MRQADSIKRLKVEDGGDGSTFVTVEFEDGSSVYENPDIIDCGYTEYVRQEDGTLEERTVMGGAEEQ